MEDSLRHAILVGHEVKRCNLMTWARWFEATSMDRTVGKGRIVGRDQIGPFFVSTVFLGVDHSWSLNGPPLWFESMVFNHDEDEHTMMRYTTWDEAASGHAALVATTKAYVGGLEHTSQPVLGQLLKRIADKLKE